ncbi:MAG: hypothetical protein EA364_00405 [Balneolaceae bacterium]|nr:MAG: hypothetical protein EA364_00405 [Balneolaceae bacterium]
MHQLFRAHLRGSPEPAGNSCEHRAAASEYVINASYPDYPDYPESGIMPLKHIRQARKYSFVLLFAYSLLHKHAFTIFSHSDHPR